ncbi:xanthine dehydrogenase accessory factor [Tahibacter aquaticus]|uniref:Xanthine dehydrogenase accessory factor n=1 Tax=Tahibacter aquaticus TaxID=520092 RepID=A0A4R6Z7D4_9GAMM|nr:XdhC/CoxI family protein [Tahibacter aquaticus]TDR47675.1 xanthine dehydrogenase accessory factor [Tahibacter aquaticus]
MSSQPCVSRADDGGSLRSLLQALRLQPSPPAALGLVVATQGSTYRKPGALVYLPANGARRGWLSGGCLEAELEQAAGDVIAAAQARHLRIDTRSDDDLVFGSASGCRGVVELMLFPLHEQAPLLAALRTLDAGGVLQLDIAADGGGIARHAAQQWHWPGAGVAAVPRWSLRLRAPPRLLLLGAGPETAPLLRLMHLLGWRVDVVEQRARWFAPLAAADAHVERLADLNGDAVVFDAAVVMSHHYSRDSEYLQFCAQSAIAWIGLLGPPARRDALLADLAGAVHAQLAPRLHAPVGLRLGGEGPEAIALAIAAALQQHAAGLG